MRLITAESRNALYDSVTAEDAGLADACGCYVFAIRASHGFTPWYVGQSQKQTIIGEAMNAANIVKYNDVLNGKQGTPVLFLLPLQTPTGRFAKQRWLSRISRISGAMADRYRAGKEFRTDQ